MTLDPRVGFWLSIVAAVISALVAGGAEFTDVFGAQNAKMILGILGIINTIINAINAVLHAIPSKNTPADAAKFLLGPRV